MITEGVVIFPSILFTQYLISGLYLPGTETMKTGMRYLAKFCDNMWNILTGTNYREESYSDKKQDLLVRNYCDKWSYFFALNS